MSTQAIGGKQERQGSRVEELTRIARKLHRGNRVAFGVLWVLAGLIALLFIAIIVILFLQGFKYLISPTFYSFADNGVGRQIFNTFYILILSEVFLFPIALAAAIYTVEYAPQGRLVASIRFAAETLAGVPSIVLGLFGFVFFSAFLGFHISRLSGALTLLCLNFPQAFRLFEDALISVPRDLREGSLALGTTRWLTIRKVVLPSAMPGLITGLILSAGKIIGETAALVYTMGVSSPASVFSLDPSIPSDTLTIHLWYIKTQGAGSIVGLTAADSSAISSGSAALLIIVLLVINLLARGVGRMIQRRVMAA